MKIYTSCSPSHVELLEKWLSTSIIDPEFVPMVFHIDMNTGNGDFQNFAWDALNESGTRAACDIIKENLGSRIGIMDCDVVFLAPFIKDIQQRLNYCDILFQSESLENHLFNPGVTFMNCTKDILKAWKMMADCLPAKLDLISQNQAMKNCLMGVRYSRLPSRYASWSNHGHKRTPVLFHANCTVADEFETSVQKKLRMIHETCYR